MVKADTSKYTTLDDWIAAICEEYHRQLLPSPGDLGGLLFSIHKHVGGYAVFEGEMEDHVTDPDKIVYEEEDIIELLKKFGFPEPVWGKVVNMSDYGKEDKPSAGHQETGPMQSEDEDE